MRVTYSTEQLAAAGPFEIGEALERGAIVYFPTSPVELPAAADLAALREQLPLQLASKIASYHPESGRVHGLKGLAVEYRPVGGLMTQWRITKEGFERYLFLRSQDALDYFDSKDVGGTPPALSITYASAPAPTHFETWLTTYFPANYVGQFVDPAGDNDGDGIANLIEYAYGFSPVSADPANSGLQVSSAAVGTDTVVTIVFRRDPLATDLTYELQTSSDLVAWSTIATSIAGAVPSGSGFVSESGSPISLVTAQETLPAPAIRFVRLRVTRAP